MKLSSSSRLPVQILVFQAFDSVNVYLGCWRRQSFQSRHHQCASTGMGSSGRSHHLRLGW
jgi:hypothetical protein